MDRWQAEFVTNSQFDVTGPRRLGKLRRPPCRYLLCLARLQVIVCMALGTGPGTLHCKHYVVSTNFFIVPIDRTLPPRCG